MTQEEKNKLMKLVFELRNKTIEEEANDRAETKKTTILQRLKYEMSGFLKVMEANDIEAQREKRLGRLPLQMFHEGKVDAYGLIINVLKDIIKDYDGKDL